MMVIENRPSKMKFFWFEEIFFVYFDFKNGCENEFEDNNKKSCSRFENRVPLKIDFRAYESHESHPTAWELRHFRKKILINKFDDLEKLKKNYNWNREINLGVLPGMTFRDFVEWVKVSKISVSSHPADPRVPDFPSPSNFPSFSYLGIFVFQLSILLVQANLSKSDRGQWVASSPSSGHPRSDQSETELNNTPKKPTEKTLQFLLFGLFLRSTGNRCII